MLLMHRPCVLAAALVASVAPAAFCAEAPHYVVTDLGSLGGGFGDASDINNRGQVTGFSTVPGGQFGRAYRTSGGPINPAADNLGLVPGTLPAAIGVAINDRGEVAAIVNRGGADVEYQQARAMLVSPTGTLADALDVGTLGGTYALPYGLNNAGQVVGRSGLAGNVIDHAFRFTPGTGPGSGMTDLGTLGTISEAQKINNLGQVVGFSVNGRGDTRAFRTAPNGLIGPETDIGTLGGATAIAYAVNDLGQVAGISAGALGGTYLFRTGPNASIVPDTDNLGFAGFPADMNNAGDVVGHDIINGGPLAHGFLVRGNTRYDLNDLIDPDSGWVIYYANAINDRGDIVGYGTLGDDPLYRPFLLTAVPEPGGVGVVLGLFAFARLRRPKRPALA